MSSVSDGPRPLTTTGVPPELWKWRHTWALPGWTCDSSKCSFQALGPVNGTWAPVHLFLPGPWAGYLWDWVISQQVWEVKPPHGPSRFITTPHGFAAQHVWVGIGTLWSLWPLEPPQLFCLRKLHPGEVLNTFDTVCWEGEAVGKAPRGEPLFGKNDSCALPSNPHTPLPFHLNLTTAQGSRFITWPANPQISVSLHPAIPLTFDWTSLIPNHFLNLTFLFSLLSNLSHLQDQVHVIEVEYNKEAKAFQAAYRVGTVCSSHNVLCFASKEITQATPSLFTSSVLKILAGIILAICCLLIASLCCLCKVCRLPPQTQK
ncbi:uncharacterized protein LOC128841603 [Malaclemys terrapin pileata]|uniref:uncharacterized protein LOC128841603 n=1 Tax=Malaclemys terrapin pileata TaxID=2991368 RepID=UPI0023A8BD73|nr:uncharacterized protein LOC128841603 [Malaclemys terrapin pileata]